MRKAVSALAVVAVVLGFGASAQETDLQRILIPLRIGTVANGAFGSEWEASVLLFNDSEAPVLVIKPRCDLGIPECSGRVVAAPRESLSFYTFGETHSPGTFVHVERATARHIRFASVLQETSRTIRQRVQLPIVRDAEFGNRIVLPDVPIDSDRRVAIRIYGADDAALEARLRVFSVVDDSSPLVDTSVHLLGSSAPTAIPHSPSYFQILDLAATFPALIVNSSLRVEIDSQVHDRKIWAFISTTDNVTQQVTVLTPQ